MKKIIVFFILSLSVALPVSAANVNAVVSDYIVAALGDGSFVIVSQTLPPVSSDGEQCSKWHFVRNGQGGLTSDDAVDKMFSNALAAKYSGGSLTVFLDATPIPNNGQIQNCFVQRVDAR